MIIKDLSVPIQILKMRALLRRIPEKHAKHATIQDDLIKFESGYRGEQYVKYYLNFLPQNNFYIFHDLRLSTNSHTFQIDVLLLTQKAAIILEVKNMFGTLFFERQFHQFIRTANDKEEGFPNPLFQVQRHRSLLKQFLTDQKAPAEFPIEYLVVISQSSSILKTTETTIDIFDKVIHAEKIPLKIESLLKRYTNTILTSRQLKKLSTSILAHHCPPNHDILQKYEVSPAELQRGVQCPDCKSIPMQRKKGHWLCVTCGITSKLAHKQAIIDYLLLVSPTITNQKCREFLFLSSRFAANRFLNSMELVLRKNGRGSSYCLPESQFEK